MVVSLRGEILIYSRQMTNIPVQKYSLASAFSTLRTRNYWEYWEWGASFPSALLSCALCCLLWNIQPFVWQETGKGHNNNMVIMEYTPKFRIAILLFIIPCPSLNCCVVWKRLWARFGAILIGKWSRHFWLNVCLIFGFIQHLQRRNDCYSSSAVLRGVV